MKGITPDPTTQNKEPPLIEDLYKSLIGMEDEKAKSLAARLEKYIKGSFSGIFNQRTTVNLTNKFVVFGIKNLEDVLRPVAMQIILDYIWTVVKKTLKKRILVVDEAWYLMQHNDSAEFLRGIVKRGRKYYLGVTTITQDVDDFLETAYGKEIVTNSSIQILLKQHSAAIDQIGEVFYLSQGEKQLLLSANKGEGIFFAGQNHVAIQIIASEDEHKLITSNPEDILKKQNPSVPAAAGSAPLDKREPLKPNEIKMPYGAPKINIPEIKTVEIKTQIGSQISDVRSQDEIKPEIKNESVLFKKPELVVLSSEPNKPAEIKTNIPFKPTDIKVEEIKNDVKKPIFIKTEEEHIPQPPQLNRNPQPVFEPNPPAPAVTVAPSLEKGGQKNVNEVKKEDNKMDYDKLFGDGIV
jgi:hypothetical protein